MKQKRICKGIFIKKVKITISVDESIFYLFKFFLII